MELRQLKTFEKAATLLSFNLAAEALHYAQSTVSAQIRALEDDLGVTLFDRVGKRITLTEAGENLLKHSQRILAMMEETYTEVTGRTSLEGSLTVRVPQTIATYYLPNVLLNYQNQHPKVRLEFTNCTVYRLANELATGAIDLAFLMTESVLSDRLNTEMLGTVELVLAVPSGHPLAKEELFDFKDFEGRTLLIPKADCDYPLGLKKTLLEERITPVSMPEFNCVEAIKHCLKAGLGVSLLPHIAVANEVEAGELSVLRWRGGHFETAVFMVWHKEKWLPPTLRAFMETVKQSW